ncbi:cytochrome b [Tropicimonas marinistellae]|uniref:cytochrome b n=1 Tax=Tropicimonas marinistellae TaxID=1739787 RepID=UPI0008356661|nr:cytochrome b [Tropicimonas marinistellae]
MDMKAEGYRIPVRVLHWLVAVLVLLMIPAGLIMVQDGLPRWFQNTLFIFHKNAGIVVLLLMLVRVFYRWRYTPPPLPDDIPGWQQKAADISHRGLYVLLFLMPVTGYVRVRAERYPIEGLDALGIGTLVPHSKALAGLAQTAHNVAAFVLIALLFVHIGAAMQHAVLRRDGVFFRMWPPFGR